MSKARRALADREFQWAAELTDYVSAIDGEHVEAKRLKATALTELGERQISAIARNYYLSAAQYLLRNVRASLIDTLLGKDPMADLRATTPNRSNAQSLRGRVRQGTRARGSAAILRE